ncbi:MAG TPA: hypothetical protein VHN79_04900 [Lacunisphaera sp.]|nr:hypothetical protein [Lacunisphaera sp.]
MSSQTHHRRGVYFLANDTVFDLTVAFLNSIRAHNPELPLQLIPFDADCDRLLALRTRHDFDVFPDLALLDQCDRISLQFHDQVKGHYRKLAAWSGRFEEFICIDVDTVVLASLDFVFPLLRDYDFVAATSGVAGHRRRVWRDDIAGSGQLTPTEIAFAADTGFIASRAGLLAMMHVQPKLADAVRCKPYMAPHSHERPLLNYLMATAGRRHTSLLELHHRYPGRTLPLEAWAGASATTDVVASKGVFYLEEKRTRRWISPILFVHWAGFWSPTPRERSLRKWLRRLGLSRAPTDVRRQLPWRELWLRFLHLDTDRAVTAAHPKLAPLQTPLGDDTARP